MPQNVTGWWTDERVKETVTSRYVHSHLRPNEAEQLIKSVFGDLSDDTYLEWILTRARRFFLTLLDAGVPDQIFGIIDDSYDDEDLPIPEDEVAALRLSLEPDKSLDRRFFKAQFKYLIRVVGSGEHIRYATEETLPVVSLSSKTNIASQSKESLDRVTLPTDSKRVFSRRRIKLGSRLTEEDVLAEIADCRRLAHEHVLSVFGSYTANDSVYVLLTPTTEHNLKSFLNDTPKYFDALPKSERRRILLNWPHCLAHGLAWLHANGRHHGCIRPTRIYVDDTFNVCLGQLDGDGVLGNSSIKDDIEAYQYAAPERWKRSVTVQSTGNGRVVLPSGGRTARKLTGGGGEHRSTTSSSENSLSKGRKLNTMRPTSTSYAFIPTAKGNSSRLRLGVASKKQIEQMTQERPLESRQSHRSTKSQGTIRGYQDDEIRHESVGSNGSGSGRVSRSMMNPVFVAAPELKQAVVQTWASAQHDQLAADVFALGTVIMDILTHLSKQSLAAFARHRGSKNRVAGRGGGLADASFHANLGQVASWAQMLQKDAEKRIKKEDGTMFKAIGPILQVIMQCLEREPMHRMTSEDLAKKLEEHIRDFASISSPHCILDLEMNDQKEQEEVRRSAEIQRNKSVLRKDANNNSELHEKVMNSYLESPTPTEKRFTASSRQFFNFDFDTQSETVVDDYSMDGSLSAFVNQRSQQPPPPPPKETETRDNDLAQNLQNLSVRQKRVSWGILEEEEEGVATAVQHAASAAQHARHPMINSDRLRLPSNNDRSSYHFPSPPTTQSPTRGLPSVPTGNDASTNRPPRKTSSRMIDRSKAVASMIDRRGRGESYM